MAEQTLEEKVEAIERYLWGTRFADSPTKSPPSINEWLPIASAPKDGSPILVYHVSAYGNFIYVADWSENQWIEAAGEGYMVLEPTHWMPLPEPPK